MKFLESYNPIDLFIMGTLLVTFVLGLWKGFLRSLSALAGLVVGVVAALKYYPVVEPYLKKISSLDPHISIALAMIIIFVAVQAVFVLIRRALEALLSVTRLGWLDRIFGSAMGVAAGLLIVAAAVQVLLIVLPEWPTVKASRLVQPLNGLTEMALTYAPKQARDQLQALITKWKVPPPEGSPPPASPRSATSGKSPAATAGPVR
jgi:membrane protein required for colicin V production